MPAPRAPVVAGLLIAALFGMPSADAMVVDCGPSVCFQYQESQAAVAVFGLPVRVGDTLRFLPPDAVALSANGSGPASLVATFIIDRVYSSAGPLASVRVRAEGDYDASVASIVGAAIDLQAYNNEGPGSGTASAVFSATGTGGPAQVWTLEAMLDLQAAFTVPSADLGISLSKLVSAATEAAGQQAWTAAKYVAVTATTVPAPPALGLFAAAAAAAALRARRRPAHPAG